MPQEGTDVMANDRDAGVTSACGWARSCGAHGWPLAIPVRTSSHVNWDLTGQWSWRPRPGRARHRVRGQPALGRPASGMWHERQAAGRGSQFCVTKR